MNNDYKKYLKTTAKQSSLTFLIKIFAYISSFLLQAIFAKYLGAKNYGLYALGINIIGISIIFTTFGMPFSMQRFLGEYLGRKEYQKAISVINSGFIAITITSIVAFFIFNLSKKFISIKIFNKPELENILFYLSILLVINSYLALLSGIYKGIKQPAKFTLYKELVERLLRITVFIGFYYLIGYKLFGAIIATSISSAIILIILIIEFKKTKLFNIKVKPIFSELSYVFKYSLNMFFVSFTYFLISQVNITISGIYLQSSQIAVYSISNSIAMLSTFFLTSINTIFGTIIAELFHTNKFEALKKIYSTIIRIVIIFTIPLTTWMIIYSKEILNFFGKEYMAGYIVLSYLALGQFVNAIVGPNGLMLSMTKHQKVELINGILIATLNITLNVVLIPKFGIIGSAIGGTIAIASINILKSIEVYYFLKIQPYNKTFIKPIISGIALVVLLIILKKIYNSYNIIFVSIMLIISYLIYIVIMTILKWDKDDIEFLYSLRTKLKIKFLKKKL